MPVSVVGASTSFPQVGANRTRDVLITEILDYTGGSGLGEARARAGRALDSAIREFNDSAWKFNRVSEDITLVNGTQTYTLSTNFRNPWVALTLDTDTKTRNRLGWIQYGSWTSQKPDQSSTGSPPRRYTAFNIHNEGKVTYDPNPSDVTSRPKVRHLYHRWIVIPAGGGDTINVPTQVEEAIYQLAVANMLAKTKNPVISITQRRIALQMKVFLEHEQRDYPESPMDYWP